MMLAIILGGWAVVMVIASCLMPWHAKRGRKPK